MSSLYEKDFHQTDISNLSFLVTGGAGFIGSNIVEYLVQHGAGKIRILDNLSEGKRENIEPFLSLDNVEFVEADISDFQTCNCLLYTSPSPRDLSTSRMPSSA